MKSMTNLKGMNLNFLISNRYVKLNKIGQHAMLWHAALDVTYGAVSYSLKQEELHGGRWEREQVP
jgi:hypothetical protein